MLLKSMAQEEAQISVGLLTGHFPLDQHPPGWLRLSGDQHSHLHPHGHPQETCQLRLYHKFQSPHIPPQYADDTCPTTNGPASCQCLLNTSIVQYEGKDAKMPFPSHPEFLWWHSRPSAHQPTPASSTFLSRVGSSSTCAPIPHSTKPSSLKVIPAASFLRLHWLLNLHDRGSVRRLHLPHPHDCYRPDPCMRPNILWL